MPAVWTQQDRLATDWAGLEAPAARVRYGCLKDLRRLGEESPELLYGDFDRVTAMLDHPNSIFRWNAAHLLGALAAADRGRKLPALVDKLLKPIRGPQMIEAANIMQAAASIALAQPDLADQLAAGILTVRHAHYETDECGNVATGHAIEALGRFFDHIRNKRVVINFVRQAVENPRPATSRKAEKFLKRRADTKKRRAFGGCTPAAGGQRES